MSEKRELSEDVREGMAKTAEGLLEFVGACPTAYHTVAEARRRLEAAGAIYLAEGEA